MCIYPSYISCTVPQRNVLFFRSKSAAYQKLLLRAVRGSVKRCFGSVAVRRKKHGTGGRGRRPPTWLLVRILVIRKKVSEVSQFARPGLGTFRPRLGRLLRTATAPITRRNNLDSFGQAAPPLAHTAHDGSSLTTCGRPPLISYLLLGRTRLGLHCCTSFIAYYIRHRKAPR